jgi:hypothetical protein
LEQYHVLDLCPARYPITVAHVTAAAESVRLSMIERMATSM